jgi:hypothetical protein
MCPAVALDFKFGAGSTASGYQSMTTYYDYLRDRVLAASVGDQVQLEHLIHAERNTLWQRMVASPAYDERSRLSALAAFDEAASAIFSEQVARFSRGAQPYAAQPHGGFPNIAQPNGGQARNLGAGQNRRSQDVTDDDQFEPPRGRSRLRDLVFLLVGAAIGFIAAYFTQDVVARVLAGTSAAPAVAGLTASQKSYKLIRSQPSTLEGEIAVDYTGNPKPVGYTCEVEATNKQILEYVKFDSACKTVSFKFLPLPTLWDNFNYLEGYLVFSTTITSKSGKAWEGSASVYFKIDATA